MDDILSELQHLKDTMESKMKLVWSIPLNLRLHDDKYTGYLHAGRILDSDYADILRFKLTKDTNILAFNLEGRSN